MKRFKVFWTNQAIEDLRHIADVVALDRPLAAQRLVQSLAKKAKLLKTSPTRCRIVSELRTEGIEHYRELIESPYRIIFKLDNRRVYVFAVLDGRRDLEDLLFSRLLSLSRRKSVPR